MNNYYDLTPMNPIPPPGRGNLLEDPRNPIPGQYHPRVHGPPLIYALSNWCEALKSGDQALASKAGNEFLMAAHREGVAQGYLDTLQAKMQGVVFAVQPPAPGCDAGTNTNAADGFDLYEPDPNYFYVLDRKSGAELGELLSDLQHANDYIERGAPAPTRSLFVGPPGCGKTVGGRWLGAQLNLPVALVRIDAVVGGTVGATAKNIRAAFEYARDHRALLLLDEFEAVAVPRSNQGANVGQWSRETTSALLQLLDSLPDEQIVIGATNHVELVDPAVQRRMWKHVYFGPPDRDARAAMVKQWWAHCPHRGEAKRELLEVTEGFSGDVLERIANDANRAAARRGRWVDVTIEDVVLAATRILGATQVEAARAASRSLQVTT